MTAVLASTCAAAAVLLALARPPTRLDGRLAINNGGPRGPGTATGGRRVAATIAAVTLVGGCTVVLDGTTLVLALVGSGCCAGVAQLWGRQRRERARGHRGALVVEVGEAMEGELRAGQPPISALVRAAEVWPDLVPVLAAARLGADVPEAFRAVATQPGAEGLHDVAAAWEVSERSGSALTTSLGQVVASARSRRLAGNLVAGELSSARATARLVAILPVGTLAMSAGLGGDPWSFLFGHPAGLACLACGIALVFSGLAWIDRIAVSVGGGR